MKIMHACKKYPHALGGDAVVVSSLRKQQQAAGFEVIVVTSNCDEIVNGPNVYKFGFKCTPSSLDAITVKRMFSLMMLFFRMFEILRKERPDVIHTHSVDMAFFTSFAARFYAIPVVHTFHIVTFYDDTQPLIRRKSEIWLAKQAKTHAVTAPNGFDVKKLQTAGLKQATLLPNGVDSTFWGEAFRGKNHGRFSFLAIGRLEYQKGYEYLIKAASMLARVQAPAFRVDIIGQGTQYGQLQSLIRSLHAENTVSLLGSKTPKEVRTLLAGADAVVVPSLYESTPITMLEAWSVGVPVIITSVGILRDTPADFEAAYVVPPKDEHSLMEAMSRCVNDESARSKVAAKGREEVQKYNWPTIAHIAELIYRGAK